MLYVGLMVWFWWIEELILARGVKASSMPAGDGSRAVEQVHGGTAGAHKLGLLCWLCYGMHFVVKVVGSTLAWLVWSDSAIQLGLLHISTAKGSLGRYDGCKRSWETGVYPLHNIKNRKSKIRMGVIQAVGVSLICPIIPMIRLYT